MSTVYVARAIIIIFIVFSDTLCALDFSPYTDDRPVTVAKVSLSACIRPVPECRRHLDKPRRVNSTKTPFQSTPSYRNEFRSKNGRLRLNRRTRCFLARLQFVLAQPPIMRRFWNPTLSNAPVSSSQRHITRAYERSEFDERFSVCRPISYVT